MPFIQQEPFTFFNIKLTDHGRYLASLGRIHFDKIVISDREIDYSIDRDKTYNIFNNRVLDVVQYYPDIDLSNFNGSPFYNRNQFNVTSEAIQITASTSSTTVFDSTIYTSSKTLNYTPNSANWGTNKITFNAGGGTPQVGQIVFIPWVAPNWSGSYNLTSLPQSIPSVILTYKIISGVSSTTFLLDRPIPNFNSPTQNPTLTCLFYEDNLIEGHLGTGKTSDPGIWNMNIVRTSTVLGTVINGTSSDNNYTSYGSIEYAGAKHYFGFAKTNTISNTGGILTANTSNDLPIVGLIHYTNKYTGNTYAEKFVEKTFEMNFPNIMWHHNYNAYYNNLSANTFSSYNGSGTTWGLFLSDEYGGTYYDDIAKTTYRELRDNRTQNSIAVGRVYHKLRTVVITDQELLTALTYKSNRNYTYPDFNVSLIDHPQNGLYPANSYSSTTVSAYTANGFVIPGNDYFVTYIPESSNFSAGSSIGNSPAMPCAYIKKISGSFDENGLPQYLKLNFPNPDSFPFMRSDAGLVDNNLKNGWNANTVQILLNIQPSFMNYDISTVPYNQWFRVSDKTLGGNGVYRASDYGDNTIDPKKFNSYEFIISQEDVASGSTYTIFSGLTTNANYLNYGDEFFFFGTIKTGILSTAFKTRIQVYLDDAELNGSNNSTFDPEIDTGTYITEIAVLDTNNQVVAVGKPTYPILKNNIRWLTLMLDIDF